jgi:hypothetical protein
MDALSHSRRSRQAQRRKRRNKSALPLDTTLVKENTN